MNKDEIINKIVKLESEIEINNEQSKLAKDAAKINKDVMNQHQKVYDDLRQQLDLIAKGLSDAAQNFRTADAAVRDISRRNRDYLDELARLRRELSRAEDAERVQAKYLAELEAFREACLKAPWRKENRTDDMGAFEYQIDGAIQLAAAKTGLLGDKRGLGKSLTSLIYCDLLDAQKVIFICPSDTMDNFIREIKMWTPHRPILKIGKMTRAERDFVFGPLKNLTAFNLVLNYEAWRRDSSLIASLNELLPDTLVYDAAHKAMTWTTSISRGIQSLRFGLNICPSCSPEKPLPVDSVSIEDFNYGTCEICGHEAFITEFCSVKNVLPMTGTPIINKPQELFPHLRAIDPKNFTDEKTYLRDFCRKSLSGRWVWTWGAEDKLVQKIGPRFVARDRKAAGIIIPPATPIDHVISLDEFKENYKEQFKAYNQVRQYAQLVLDPEKGADGIMAMQYMIVVLMRLRQVLVWPAGIELKRKDEYGNEYHVARLNVHESVKVDKAEELLREIQEEGEASLAFSMFNDPLYELQRRLGSRSLAYTGNTPSYLKNDAQLDFDPKTAPKNPKWDILLGNYKAMGTGLNLNRATHEIMLDRPWNPAGEEQAEGRVDRIGTKQDTYIHRIMVEGTIDTWMKQLIEQKQEIISGFAEKADLYQEVLRALREGEI